MKRVFNILIISLLLVSCTSKPQQKELVILSVNDMHSHIENMPKLAYIADSLRNIYPELLIVSAGDNRTGSAYNDKYPVHPNFPMINLMNEVGFEVSALGNHEFDGNIDGLKYFIDNTNFPVVCANADFSAYPDIPMPDYVTITKNINGKDLKIIVLGMIETENDGHPSAHIKNMKDIVFTDAKDVIKDYLYLRDSCDVFILLSHCGKTQELEFAAEYPQFDVIIGGHSHDLWTEQLPNGVLYTQSKYYLRRATVTKLKIEEGKVVDKEAQVIDLEKNKGCNESIQAEVDKYYAEPEFHKVIGHAKTPFNNVNALGAFMADAARYATKADIAMQNPGGVRLESLHGGDIETADIYNVDPFNNALLITEMTGEQVEEFLTIVTTKDGDLPYVSGITYTAELAEDEDDNIYVASIKAYLENGKPINQKKIYKVAINSYMALWAEGHCLKIETTDINANDAEFLYLKDFDNVDYQGVCRYKIADD